MGLLSAELCPNTPPEGFFGHPIKPSVMVFSYA